MPRQNVNDLLAFLAVARETELHQGGREAGGFAVGVEPYRSRARSTTRTSIADAHDTERLADRGGERLLQTVGHRFEEIEAELEALSALRDKHAGTIPHFGRRACGQCDPLARLDEVPAALPPGHQGRDRDRPRPDRHRWPSVYDAGVRSGEQVAKDMIDRPYRTGHAYGGRRCPVIFREAIPSGEAAGPDRAQLHQSATTDLWRPVCWEFEKATAS